MITPSKFWKGLVWESIAISLAILMSGIIWDGTTSGQWSEPRAGPIQMNGDWNVTGFFTYADTEITVNGNVTVSGTLVLDSCDLIINSTLTEPRGLVVVSGGTLWVMNGSLIGSLPTQNIFFVAEKGSSVLIDNSSVFGCGIANADHIWRGVCSMTDNFTIAGSSIFSGYSGLVADNGTFDLGNVQVIDMAAEGILLMNDSVLDFDKGGIRTVGGVAITSKDSMMDLANVVTDNVLTTLSLEDSLASIRSCMFSSQMVQLMVLKGSAVTIVESHPIDPASDDIELDRGKISPSSLLMVNCSFPDIIINDAGSSAYAAKTLDVLVLGPGKEPAPNAEIEVLDVNGTRIATGLTDDRGLVHDLIVPFMAYDSFGRRFLTPHTVWAFLEGASRSKQVNVTSSYMVQIDIVFSFPGVDIISPLGGTWYDRTPILLDVGISSSVPVVKVWLSIDGRPEVEIGSTSSIRMGLAMSDGEHSLRVVAYNEDGRYGNSTVDFGVDTTAPVLDLDPYPSSTNDTVIRLTGGCSQDAILNMGGKIYPVVEGGFDIAISLVEGLNRMTLTAVDRAGNTDSANIEIVLDTIPPSIQVYTPVNGSWMKERTVTVKGMVDQTVVSVEIGGKQGSLEDSQFTCIVEGLSEGYNRLTIVATDQTGTRAWKDIVVFVDTEAPEIVITDPPTVTNLDTIMITGFTDTVDAMVRIGGQIATVNGLSFNALVRLTRGENWIEIVVQDQVGNMNRKTILVLLDLDAPLFEVITPMPGSVLSSNVLEVQIEVFDENDVASVRARMGSGQFQELSRDDGVWSWVFSLLPGENILDVEAVDMAGNVANRQLIYTYSPHVDIDDTPPSIWFVYPEKDQILNVGEVNVEGRAEDDTELSRVELWIGDERYNVTGLEVWHTMVVLGKGHHYLRAVAFDTSGNVNQSIISVRVIQPALEDGEEDNGSGYLVYIFVMIVLIALLGVIIFFLVRNNRMKADLLDKAEQDERGHGGGSIGVRSRRGDGPRYGQRTEVRPPSGRSRPSSREPITRPSYRERTGHRR